MWRASCLCRTRSSQRVLSKLALARPLNVWDIQEPSLDGNGVAWATVLGCGRLEVREWKDVCGAGGGEHEAKPHILPFSQRSSDPTTPRIEWSQSDRLESLHHYFIASLHHRLSHLRTRSGSRCGKASAGLARLGVRRRRRSYLQVEIIDLAAVTSQAARAWDVV
jgi:hypothetical protein